MTAGRSTVLSLGTSSGPERARSTHVARSPHRRRGPPRLVRRFRRPQGRAARAARLHDEVSASGASSRCGRPSPTPILTPLAIADGIEVLAARRRGRAHARARGAQGPPHRRLERARTSTSCASGVQSISSASRLASATLGSSPCAGGTSATTDDVRRRTPSPTTSRSSVTTFPSAPVRAGWGRPSRSSSASCSRGRRVSDLTDKQLRRWDDLREHNRHDCAGMRRVTILAADEIAEEDRRAQRSSRLARKPHLVRSRAGAA